MAACAAMCATRPSENLYVSVTATVIAASTTPVRQPLPVVVLETDKVRFTQGDRSIYNSSSGIGRGIRGQCGTTLTWEGRGSISLQIGTLDNPDNHVPSLHWFYEERIPWFDVASDLPHLET